MNKIVLDKELKDYTNSDIEVSYQKQSDLLNIPCLSIKVNNKTDLLLELNGYIDKINIDIVINCDCNIYIDCTSDDMKIKYHYSINNSSKCNVYKYNQVNHINEMCVVDLDSIGSDIEYIFKSICTYKENYDYVINHNCQNTISNITNNGVNKSGAMNIQISGYIPKNIIGCTCNQNNRIINLTNNKCEIRPNLYIDCDDVNANHSALIGKFDDNEMFYLNSRGISEIDATNLLIKGFILNGMENEDILKKITKDIDKYWR